MISLGTNESRSQGGGFQVSLTSGVSGFYVRNEWCLQQLGLGNAHWRETKGNNNNF